MNIYNKSVDFLARVRDNNSKEWMDANRAEYNALRKEFEQFIASVIEAIKHYDPTLRGVSVKDCIFRINRNMRFSSDKRPYKTHFSAFIAIGGRNGGYCGYYIHIEPEGDVEKSYKSFGGSMLAVGAYAPTPEILKSIREEILSNGEAMQAAIDGATGFTLHTGDDCLKRTPQGYPKNSPYDHLLRLRRVSITKKVSQGFFDDNNLVDKIAREFSQTVPLAHILNRAIEYALSNEGYD